MTMGFFHASNPLLGGKVGMELNDFMQDYIGLLGAIVVMIILGIIYMVLRLNITPEKVSAYFTKKAIEVKDSFEPDLIPSDEEQDWEKATVEGQQVVEEIVPPIPSVSEEMEITIPEPEIIAEPVIAEPVLKTIPKTDDDDVDVEINAVIDEDEDINSKAEKIVEDFGEFDPTLELSNFKFPPLELLKDYSKGKTITINEEELQANKLKIVETLNNYKIGIAKITATIGPTVTLYEIVPEAGVRISKIKNLEDDIALSLAALGIRIIAPIPGKGTIGIEVPNQNPSIVSMRSVIASPKFQKAEMELPIAFGKTISNETFVVDLAKMPHLLMAGATGQGKSVVLMPC